MPVSCAPVERGDVRLVMTWTQLRAEGVTADRIRAQIDAGRWQRCGYAVVLHNGPLSERQHWLVARAHAGPSALLTGFTAARAHGLRGWERDRVDLLAPPGARLARGCPVPVRLHRVRHWDRVRATAGTLVHALPDALLVAAGSFESPRPACGLLAAAVQQRRVRPATLADALGRATRVRHRCTLISAVADIAQGSEALSEIDFVRLCRRAGLPEPERQSVRVDSSGRRRYLDASWRRRDGRLIVVEVDGALHLIATRWWADQLRQNELSLADALVLRYPSIIVRTEPELVVRQLRQALWL